MINDNPKNPVDFIRKYIALIIQPYFSRDDISELLNDIENSFGFKYKNIIQIEIENIINQSQIRKIQG